jgi:rare lipoprotein A
VSGRHRPNPTTRLTPRLRLVLSAAAASTLALGTIGILGITDGDSPDSVDVIEAAPRAAQDRADRAQRPTVSPTSSPRPTVTPPSPSVSLSAAPPPPAPAPPRTPPTTPPPASPRAKPRVTTPVPPAAAPVRTCDASFYETGETTANGEPFDPDGLTAAHKTFAFGTRVKVTNKANGQSVTVRINDRGPFVEGRCLDLARGAFEEIASVGAGVITVSYQVL